MFYKSINSSGDFFFYSLFFNYTNYCFFDYIVNFFIELLLTVYIIYNFLFFKEKRLNFKSFLFQYIFFLIFLLGSTFLVFFFTSDNSLIFLYFINNKFIVYSKMTIILLLILILLISKNKLLINPRTISLNEIPSILSFLILFICILFSSYDFFIIYLSIEGISLVIYTLGSLMNESLINLEAILKYFLINNLASALLLWSISYIYILTGSTDCFELQYLLIHKGEDILTENIYLICSVLLFSLFVKLAVFPFQWWVADIYEGLWTPVLLCYAVLVKISFFLFFFKIILNIFAPITCLFQPILWLGSVGSLIIGSLGALTQVKIKRFMGYTSVAQSSYIILGLSCNSLNGAISSFFFLIMYCLITLAFFSVILNIEHVAYKNNMIYLNQLYTLIVYNKEISLHLIIIIFVMAAIPPFSSFFAKFFIFIVSIEANLELIIIFFLGFTLVSTFYYLNFIQQMVFFKSNELKTFIFSENYLILNYLRFNSVFFLTSYLYIPYLYEIISGIALCCLWPLSY